MSSFNSSSEEVKSAASYALGQSPLPPPRPSHNNPSSQSLCLVSVSPASPTSALTFYCASETQAAPNPVWVLSFEPTEGPARPLAQISYPLPGNISVGNLNLYLPFILREVESNSKRQYLLLHSLKEIITSMSESQEHIQSLKVG